MSPHGRTSKAFLGLLAFGITVLAGAPADAQFSTSKREIERAVRVEWLQMKRSLPRPADPAIQAFVESGRPFLGICVGMQLMASRGLEHGEHAGLGWIAGDVVALAPADAALKIPHMGWNELILKSDRHPVLDDLGAHPHVYFVHSYHFRPADPAHLLAEVDYGGPVAAIVGRDNLLGTQFHPEKSQTAGLRLLANFLRWSP